MFTFLVYLNDNVAYSLCRPPVKTSLEELGTESSSDNDTDTPDSPLIEPAPSLFPLKSRPVLQRRNTITGASPTSTKPYPGIEQVKSLFSCCVFVDYRSCVDLLFFNNF